VLPLRSESYAPRAVMDGVLRALEPVAAKKGLSLRASGDGAPDRCVGDPVRIAQVLGNLVTNAIKFTEHGSVELTLQGHGDAEYRVLVDDTGPGMPEDEQLFSPFQQGDSAGLTGGVGLGLAISRQLCERMGGTLESARSPAGGARFVATFPSVVEGREPSAIERFAPDDAGAPLTRSFAQRHPLNVLVIDDLPPAREFMHAALATLGYEATLAASADEGLARAETGNFGLVLLDLQMPGTDGWSAARSLRARLGPAPFLVALTANALANDAVLLEGAGFDGFAQKPLRLRELSALLRRSHERLASAHGASEFDAERWRELAAMPVGDGETLLHRMQRRVSSALPGVWEQVQTLREQGEPAALGRALHDLHGLLSLIGATRAAEQVGRAEHGVERGGVEPSAWAELEQRIAAVRGELARQPSLS
jgi:CheY-like chemotaxis protein